MERDIFTANIYYYIRTEFDYALNVTLALQYMEVLCYNGLNLCKGLCTLLHGPLAREIFVQASSQCPWLVPTA